MRVLLTGSAGFIGRHVNEYLVQSGHEIVGVDRASFDLAEPWNVFGKPFDAVVHAAGKFHGIGVSIGEVIRDNVIATQRVVDYAARTNVRMVIYLSSVSVNGTVEGSTLVGSSPVIDPNIYGIAKLASEMELFDLPTSTASISIRLPAVIGNGAILNWPARVLQLAQSNSGIRISNPRAKFNNAVHVGDVAKFIRQLIETEHWSWRDTITIASEGHTTVESAVEIICYTIGSASKIRIADPSHSFTIGIERARQRYGFQAMDISEALQRFAAESRNVQ